MENAELIKALKEDAEWAHANEWETPITLGDHLDAAAAALEAAEKRVKELETIVTNAEKCDFENRTDCDYCENIQRAVIRIAELEAAQRWISVKERLPTVSEYRNGDKFKSMDSNELVPFLVCCEDTEIPFRAFYDGKNWGDGWGKQNVTHWRKLPQPPQKG